MFKEFLMKKLMAQKLKNLPQSQQDAIISVVTKNPKLFEEIAMKIKKRTDAGANETMASMTVMKEYAPQIQKLMQE
ncbi:MAG: hypothetical protein ABL860_01175 [Candidatus Nitrotoga sp.]